MRYIRLYNTVKFLKFIQIKYRVYYFFRKKMRLSLNKKYHFFKGSNIKNLSLQQSIHIMDVYREKNEFTFLNLQYKFDDNIDWNFSKYGKLWTYNLNYFDCLSQENSENNLLLIHSFIHNIENIKDGLEPFPISLRGINWIKYLSYYNIKNKSIDDSLYAQYYMLFDNLEYHLLGNHLLENGFSLLFGAYYFQDDILYKKAKEILEEQLEEQILNDGMHFELSPMYHQIMLFRLLDCINLLKNNKWKDDTLLIFLTNKSAIMLGGLESITYENGDIPLFNDSTHDIAPTSVQLFEYADRLKIITNSSSLSDSGYRKIVKENYECIIDIGQIGANYIPGHAHADTFNFELRVEGRPFIVDMGLSTYETNERRRLERSTASHNTVELNGENQSDVWGGFRVANRANIVFLKENEHFIKATHDGYKKDNILHTRKWRFDDFQIDIEDSLTKQSNAIARFHFHPAVSEEEILERIIVHNKEIFISTYHYALGFNVLVDALVVEVPFRKELKVTILI